MEITIIDSYCNKLHPSQSYLVLDDGGISVVKPNEEVVWKVNKKLKISSILIKDDKSINLFVPDPAPVKGDFKIWKGTVRGNLTAGEEENYRIYWSEEGVVYSYDPKIQVNN